MLLALLTYRPSMQSRLYVTVWYPFICLIYPNTNVKAIWLYNQYAVSQKCFCKKHRIKVVELNTSFNAEALFFPGGIAICYVLQVLWMTSYLHTAAYIKRCGEWRYVQDNVPAALYWLRRVLDDGERQDEIVSDERRGGACNAPLLNCLCLRAIYGGGLFKSEFGRHKKMT